MDEVLPDARADVDDRVVRTDAGVADETQAETPSGPAMHGPERTERETVAGFCTIGRCASDFLTWKLL
ncbi:hypothetical protein GCM10011376_37090 [Nocardioides flavus (ex Wang et al. 2016)]|uniref:Uncharacterized protein n=1 Tax=Nocardioides flavus (ex Wang et al. 2016) TaxID=2058780 RepID=A0ABQ3HSF3_9ACTN|nr:hypothetical protein GCM10011376_37090 [Nocardioides flavus (ex Wang et al. 2016)]